MASIILPLSAETPLTVPPPFPTIRLNPLLLSTFFDNMQTSQHQHQRQVELASFHDLLDQPSSSTHICSFLDSLATTESGPGSGSGSSSHPDAEIASYPDGTFENYHSLGLSLFFSASSSSASQPVQSPSDERRLERADIYNERPPPPASVTTPTPTPPGGGSAGGSMGRSRRPKRPRKVYAPPPDLILEFPSTSIPLPPRPIPPSTAGNTSSTLTPSFDNTPAYSRNSAGSPNTPTSLTRAKRFCITPWTTAAELVQNLGEPTRKGGDEGGWVGPWLEWGSVELCGSGSGNGIGSDGVDGGSGVDRVGSGIVKIGMMVELAPSTSGSWGADGGDSQTVGAGKTGKKEGEKEKTKGFGVWDHVGGWTWGVIKVFKAG